MAKIELNGFFINIGKEEAFGEKKTRVQKIIFKVPAYTDKFGEKKGEDELWELSVMGANIDKLDLPNKCLDSCKAKLTCYVNAKVWYKKEDAAQEEPQYSLYAVLSEVEHIQ